MAETTGAELRPCRCAAGDELCSRSLERPEEIDQETWGRAAERIRFVKLKPTRFERSKRVRAMSFSEQAAYARILIAQARDESFPADPERVRRLLGAEREEWDLIWSSIEELFPVWCDGERRNPQMAHELHAAVSASARMAIGGGRSKPPKAKPEAPSKAPSNGAPEAPPLSLHLADEDEGESGNCRTVTASRAGARGPSDEDVGQMLDALQASVRPIPWAGRTDGKWQDRQRRHLRLLCTSGGLSDPRDKGAPVAPAQSPTAVLAALRFIGAQPLLSGSGSDFSWRPQILSAETLRRKWPKIARSMIESDPKRARDLSRDELDTMASMEFAALLRGDRGFQASPVAARVLTLLHEGSPSHLRASAERDRVGDRIAWVNAYRSVARNLGAKIEGGKLRVPDRDAQDEAAPLTRARVQG